ncbi:transcriptional regulator, DeoR family [Kosakonia oryziphila]|uniref:Transcriptional regulator, DeoR family n=2 Tax=Kosakonia oryziphila TaxID=1005667 RepID=A0A1C4AHA8_9ENTR|nr:transcriptional regulator, DeoR family [Kosakonia oryziphila]
MTEEEQMKAARQQTIIDLLRHHQSLTTEALSVQLNVSKETIRRDLSALQVQGKVLRNHGRARTLHRENQDSGDPFHIRLKSHYAHKADIARKALGWIEEGMVIALDASSTCWYLARQLPDCNLHVFTNSHPICQELGKREHLQLSSSGGTLERKYGCYVNRSLISQIKSLDIDLFIFSCEGIDSNGALWDSNIYNAEFKSILLRRAAQSLLLIDKSKFNRSGEAQIGHLDGVTHIISDSKLA